MALDSDPARFEAVDAKSRPADLAAEFLVAQGAGESPVLERFLARLEDEEERRELLQLIEGATRAARALPRTLAPGSLVASRYRVTEKLGGGGMGEVHAARDEKLERDVAVKVLNPLVADSREREDLFGDEWRILAELNHPGIVAVHDAGDDGGFTYIVMDKVDGTAVSDVVDRAARELATGGSARNGEVLARSIGKPLAPGRRDLIDPHDYARSVARIVLEIARTLEAAHGKGVVHRDLKPANVMLLGGGAPIVLDFGLAGSAGTRKSAESEKLHGSLPYVAPEQARTEKPGMDPRTDVYQLGLILYEMLTLKRAFPGTATGDVLRRIQQGYFEKPRKIVRSIPRDLEAICMRALEVEPSRRYASAQALREDLEAWLEGRAPVASRHARWRSFLRTARYTARRHPVLAALAGMLIVGGATWVSLRVSDPGSETSFFRMVPEGKIFSIVPIRDRRKQVEVGDLIGFSLPTSDVDVYALSVFDPGNGQLRVVPWKTTVADDLNRIRTQKQKNEAWGFHVPPTQVAITQVLCTELRQDSGRNAREGLLVMVSRKKADRPTIEAWMDRLVGHGVVSLDRAEQLLTDDPFRTRGDGPPPGAEPFDPELVESAKKALAKYGKDAVYRLPIPDVDEYSIECRVIGP